MNILINNQVEIKDQGGKMYEINKRLGQNTRKPQSYRYKNEFDSVYIIICESYETQRESVL